MSRRSVMIERLPKIVGRAMPRFMNDGSSKLRSYSYDTSCKMSNFFRNWSNQSNAYKCPIQCSQAIIEPIHVSFSSTYLNIIIQNTCIPFQIDFIIYQYTVPVCDTLQTNYLHTLTEGNDFLTEILLLNTCSIFIAYGNALHL